MWSPTLRKRYMVAITNRVRKPKKYETGKAFVREWGFQAPLEVLSFLEIEPVQVHITGDEAEIEDFSEAEAQDLEEGSAYLPDPQELEEEALEGNIT